MTFAETTTQIPTTRPVGVLSAHRAWRRLGPRVRQPFPFVGGNAIEFLDLGKRFFDRMLEAIDTAAHSVDVEMYLWDDDVVGRSFVEALRRAAERGLRVRVLIDAMGARAVRTALRGVLQAGGDVREFNPFHVRVMRRFFHRTHKKILVLDGQVAFTGGAGFSLYFSTGKRREMAWHDRMFEVRGPVARQLLETFEADFGRWRAAPGVEVREVAQRTPDPSPAGSARMRVLRGWPDARDFRHEVRDAAAAAQRRLWFGSPYFIPPPALWAALRGAIKRGVDMQLVLPSRRWAHPVLWHASRRHYAYFLKRGARIFEFESVFYHAKLAVKDDDVALIGSSNLDSWSWSRNAEVDLLITDLPTVARVAESFLDDRARSREVTLDDLRRETWWRRAKETLAGMIERWL